MSSKHALLSVDETRALFDRAFQEYDDSQPEEWDDDDAELKSARMQQALTALLYACSVAALHADPSLLSSIAVAASCFEEYEYQQYEDAPALAIAATIRANAASHGEIAALVDDETASVRSTLAESLDGADPNARNLLESLALDDDADVAAIARKKLGAHRPMWWVGKLSRDPAETLSTPDLKRAEPIFKTIAEILELGQRAQAARAEELAKLATKLPTPVLFDICLNVAVSREAVETHVPLLGAAASKPGGEQILIAVVDRLADTYMHLVQPGLLAALAKATKAHRRKVASGLIDEIFRREPTKGFDDPCSRLATIAITLVDPASRIGLLETVVAHPDHQEASSVEILMRALSEGPDERSPALIARSIELLAGDRPDVGPKLRERLRAVLLRARPATLRPLAQAALRSDDKAEIEWALQALILRCFDAKKDGPRKAFIGKLWNDRRVSPVLRSMSIVAPHLLTWTRPLLRAGTLSLSEANLVLRAIENLYGIDPAREAVSLAKRFTNRTDAQIQRETQARLAEQRGEVADLLGPRALRTHATDEDFDGYRSIVAQSTGETDWLALHWAPSKNGLLAEDRPALDRAIASTITGDVHAAMSLWKLASAQPCRELLDIVGEVRKKVTENEVLYWLKSASTHLHDALGIPRVKAGTSRAEGADKDGADDAQDDDDWLDDDE